MFRYVVGIAVDDTGWLPTHEMALWIFAEAVNAIQVSPPPSASDHLFLAHRAQRNPRRCIPSVILFIDSSQALPARIPVGAIGFFVKVNRHIDPIPGGGNLKLAIVIDFYPIIAEKKLDHITVPKLEAVFGIVRRQPEIQFGVWRDEEQIQIGVGPESTNLCFDLWIIVLTSAVSGDPCGRRMGPRPRMGIRIQLRGLRNMRDGEGGRRRWNFADLGGSALLNRLSRMPWRVASRSSGDSGSLPDNDHHRDQEK